MGSDIGKHPRNWHHRKKHASSRMDPSDFFFSAGCGELDLATPFEAADQSEPVGLDSNYGN